MPRTATAVAAVVVAATVAAVTALALLRPPASLPPRVIVTFQPPPSNTTAAAAIVSTCATLPTTACESVLSTALLAVVGRPTRRAVAALAAAGPIAAVEPDAVVRRAAVSDAVVRRDEALGARLGEPVFVALAADAARVLAAGAAATPGPRPPGLWGLARASRRGGGAPLDAAYAPAARYAGALGAGVTIYVADSGVAAAHAEFGGRVAAGPDFCADDGDAAPQPAAANDAATLQPAAADACDGHGTHVASIAAGAAVGVAPRATVVALRVLSCGGRGRASAVARAVDWVVRHRTGPAVIVLSLGAPTADGGVAAMEAALAGAAAAGVVVVAAAGNGGGDACGASPARLDTVITVAASDSRAKFGAAGSGRPTRRPPGGTGALAAVTAASGGDGGRPDITADPPYKFTDSGRCVDLFAPGADILAACGGPPGARCADPAAPGALAFASGTSMAAPAVAGAAALALAAGVAPGDVAAALVAAATEGAVEVGGLVAGTPSRLLYVGE